MTEERRLMMAGIPIEDAICMCNCLRREGDLEDYVRREEKRHECRCENRCAKCGCV